MEDVFLRENDVKELLEMERGLNLLRNDCLYVLQMSSMAGNFVFFVFLCCVECGGGEKTITCV